MYMANITALVHITNSKETLPQCLDSLAWVETVLVIDMESSDGSVEIARQYPNVKVFSHKNAGYVEPARNFALQKVKTDWTLIVDADEEVPPELAQTLQEIAETNDTSTPIYFLSRKNIIFDQWIAHTGWWPDYQLRFFRTGTVTWPEEIHAQPQLQGKSSELPAKPELALLHHNYQTVEQFIDRMNRYTSIEVAHHQNGQHGHNAHKTSENIDRLPTIFSQEFSRRYFAEEGYADGRHGIALAYLQSLYQITTALKSWQAEGFQEVIGDHRNHAPNQVTQIESSLKELRYWVTTYHLKHASQPMKIWWKIRRKLGI